MKTCESGAGLKSGFSIMEVVATLVVLGILAVLIVAGGDTNARVAAEAGTLRAHLGFAQSMALANNTASWSVQFNANAYRLRRDGQLSPVPWPNESSATHQLPAGVSIVQGLGFVTFDQWGAPTNTHVVVLSDGSHQQSVSILQFTGLIQ